MLMRSKSLIFATVTAALAGCQGDRCCLIGQYAQSAATIADSTPAPAGRSASAVDGVSDSAVPSLLPLPAPGAEARTGSRSSDNSRGPADQSHRSSVQPVGFHQASDSGLPGAAENGAADSRTTRPPSRFAVPRELPGADAGPLRLPAYDEKLPLQERRSLLESLFPELPSEVPEQPAGERAEQPLTLAELQQLALANSPVINQAAADVESARGQAIQVGLYPNPTVGYEGDTIGTARTAGYNGAYVSQEFITAGKLTLAQDSALMDMQAAEADLRKVRIKLASNVRRSYFRLLVARERLKFSRALATLSEEVYQAQIDLVAAGENAPYEPLQLRVLAVQARNSVVQSDNLVTAAWRQLAATLGLPKMARSEVAGSIEIPAPQIDYDTARAMMLSVHSDLIAAQARISSAGYNLQLQEVTPIPNLEVYSALQHDDTTPLNNMSFNLQIGIPVPLYNRNQGNITSAHAQVTRSQQDLIDAQNSLQNSLAEVFGRYASSTTIASTYRTDILQDQVRVYRGVYDRFREAGGEVDFAQIVVAQQTLSQAVLSYLDVLGSQWDATVDLAEILQADDLFAIGRSAE